MTQQETASTTRARTGNGHHVVEDKVEGTASIFVFGRNLGGAQRKSLADSEPLHKAWMKADDHGKRALKLEFMIGYIVGVMNSQRDTAETIINGRVRFGAQPTVRKPARSKEQQNAYDAARKMFAFHISREDSRLKERRHEPKRMRLSAEFKAAAVAFVEQFYEEANVASIGEVIKQLIVLKKRLATGAKLEETNGGTK